MVLTSTQLYFSNEVIVPDEHHCLCGSVATMRTSVKSTEALWTGSALQQPHFSFIHRVALRKCLF